MNLIYIIQKSHMGSEKNSSRSTLHDHMNFWERKRIPSKKPPFHLLEELVLHSFDACVLGLLYVCLQKQDIDIKDMKAVSAYLNELDTSAFLRLVDEIYSSAFTSTACNPSSETIDEEFLNHVRFLQLVIPYKALKYGIKHADIGLIKRVIVESAVLFEGSRSYNYATEMLHLIRMISTPACDPTLQQAILSNSLVNLQGAADTWHETDLFLEHLNLDLKRLLYTRRNSTF